MTKSSAKEVSQIPIHRNLKHSKPLLVSMNIPKQYGVVAIFLFVSLRKVIVIEANFSFGKLSLTLLDLLNIMPLV